MARNCTPGRFESRLYFVIAIRFHDLAMRLLFRRRGSRVETEFGSQQYPAGAHANVLRCASAMVARNASADEPPLIIGDWSSTLSLTVIG